MKSNIYEAIDDYFHKESLKAYWKIECQNGEKKLEEIRTLLNYLENSNQVIPSLEYFVSNIKYTEFDVTEPGDLEYLSQKYQVTTGNREQYGKIRSNVGKAPLILSAIDITSERALLSTLFPILKTKELKGADDIILLIRMHRRNLSDYSYTPNFKIDAIWKDVSLVFDDKNISIKKH